MGAELIHILYEYIDILSVLFGSLMIVLPIIAYYIYSTCDKRDTKCHSEQLNKKAYCPRCAECIESQINKKTELGYSLVGINCECGTESNWETMGYPYVLISSSRNCNN